MPHIDYLLYEVSTLDSIDHGSFMSRRFEEEEWLRRMEQNLADPLITPT